MTDPRRCIGIFLHIGFGRFVGGWVKIHPFSHNTSKMPLVFNEQKLHSGWLVCLFFSRATYYAAIGISHVIKYRDMTSRPFSLIASSNMYKNRTVSLSFCGTSSRFLPLRFILFCQQTSLELSRNDVGWKKYIYCVCAHGQDS